MAKALLQNDIETIEMRLSVKAKSSNVLFAGTNLHFIKNSPDNVRLSKNAEAGIGSIDAGKLQGYIYDS